VLSHAKSISAETQNAGLWLLHGEAPPRSPPEPVSRPRQLLDHIASAARWAGWMAPAGGLILILLAVSLVLRSAPPGAGLSAGLPAVAPQPMSPLVAGHSLIPPPSTQLPDVRLDHVQMPPLASAQTMTQPTEGQMVKWRERRKSPASVRRTHASFARRGPPVLIPGVLTPPKD
jgi:hypothetical protein